jgi:uncharacterized phage protein (TIGR02216 family)
MTRQSGPFDWPALMRAGLQGLGLHPSVFWQLTPAELQMMLGRFRVETPLGRDRLSALIDAYPDEMGAKNDGF